MDVSWLEESMDIEVGETMVELEGRFLCVRTRETNLGNLVCDLLRAASGEVASPVSNTHPHHIAACFYIVY